MEGEEKATQTVAEPVKTTTGNESEQNNSGTKIILIIIGVILVLAGLVWLFIYLGPEVTGMVRDVSLVIYVLESLVSVAALVVLCVNAARLINFLKYEIEPILKKTDKTVKKVSGTVSFLCDNAVEPTTNAISTVSGIKSAVDTFLSVFKK